jgi:acyl carrier protein
VTGSIATEIIDRLARERGLPRERIRLSDRLLQDIGLDGDDAVDFFVSLQDRFGTDLTHLREHWSEHFRSERTLLWTAVVPIPSFIVAVLVAGFSGSKVWGGAAGLAFAAIFAGIMLRRPAADTMVPITVDDVVAAAEAGTWTEQTRS